MIDDVSGAVCKLGHSFTPSTKVVSASGAMVAISSLKVGDKVRSLNVKTGKSSARVVTRVHVNHDSDLLDLTVVRNGHRAVLHTTARHPFWSQTRKAWVRADELATTDQLRTDQLKTDKTGAVRVARVVAVPGDQARWDITVATDHDYYILAGNAPVLVHNCGDGAANGADNVANGVRLRAQLTGQEISGGHAFGKHVIDKAEFPGITTRSQFASHIEDVVTNGVMRPLERGRSAYWRDGTVVIRDPNHIDGGTAFRPTDGYDYFLGLD